MPEGVYPIVEATLYLAAAPKSNSAGAYFKAVTKVEEQGKVQVPQPLQDGTPSAGDAAALHHGEGYVYPHAEPGHHVGRQYLPAALLGAYFYSPSEEGNEALVKDRLARWRAAQEKALGLEQTETLPELSGAEVLDVKRHRTARSRRITCGPSRLAYTLAPRCRKSAWLRGESDPLGPGMLSTRVASRMLPLPQGGEYGFGCGSTPVSLQTRRGPASSDGLAAA